MDALALEAHQMRTTLLGKMTTARGCAELKLKLYNKYVIGYEKLQIIEWFGKRLNQLDIFSFFRDNISNETLYTWFTQSGRIIGDLLNSLLDSFFGDVQPEDIGQARKCERLFRPWLASDLVTPERLTWLHQECFGYPRSTEKYIKLKFFEEVQG